MKKITRQVFRFDEIKEQPSQRKKTKLKKKNLCREKSREQRAVVKKEY